ncbi:HAD family hydrolase [Polymorphum gilvum]|uniref:phosphoglycolate phosphatase n=1 Tax=Polymorphum gilvum (strain LMG 25793 / CGMCC 1.9160 / SL003B-26A1) TaxID=991905 RepID=F2IY96_POLGS|nr:HAD family hydrolase [Polymorphum gilvum]ADZ71708.1 Haloacid dehalogenase-like hydrolase, putative [Polymorphum gilvum SL003B-26A1]
MDGRHDRAIRAVLFDKDGTLIDFQKTWSPAFVRLVDTFSAGDADLRLRLAEVCAFDLEAGLFAPESPFVAGSNDILVADWAAILGVPDPVALMGEINRHLVAFGLASLSPFPGLADAVGRLRAGGYVLGVATNDTEISARAQIDALGLAPSFPHVFGYDSGFGAKPGPGMVHAFAEAAGIPVSAVAMVGDSLHDLHAGRAAGARALAVTTGTVGAEVLAPHADAVFSGLHDLVAWLSASAAAAAEAET